MTDSANPESDLPLTPDEIPTLAADGSGSSDKPAGATPAFGGEAPGSTIGLYTLIEKLGEGGFGSVWRATQSEPVAREVALKILKPGMDSGEVLARFEQERQTLARLSHPNIARIFDAGTTELGRPYFVMELALGKPVTTYCDGEQLAIQTRLDVFLAICAAVRHAHQKGIIHRDLKPSNILVESTADGPRVKVIDYGIAKAMNIEEDGHEGFTLQGTVIGTPQYMSPEQTGMDGRDIDTRADIYSLGVILYELLTGVTPLDPKALHTGGLEEMLRLIREEDAGKPSTHLVHRGGDREDTSGGRATSLKKLAGILRGDLDWITLKALEKEPDRRYETVNALVQDIRRYLASEPVLASPPSATYRLGKFARRNRVLVGSLATISAVVVAAVIVSTREAIRANRAEGEAIEQKDAADHAKNLAEKRADTIRRNLYVAEMNVAADVISRPEGLKQIEELTEKWIPGSGEEDLRGWEWYYLHSQGREEEAIYRGHGSEVEAVVWGPDGSRVASGDIDGNIRIWDPDTLETKLQFRSHPSYLRGMDWNPNGKLIASGAEADNAVAIWNAMTGDEIFRGQTDSSVISVAWSPDGASLMSGNSHGQLHLWSMDSSGSAWGLEKKFAEIRLPRRIKKISWSPDGSMVAASFSFGLSVWQFPSGIRIPEGDLLHSGSNSVTWHPKGTALAAARIDESSFYVWKYPSWRTEFNIRAHATPVLSLAWSGDGTKLASSSVDRSIKIWNASSGLELDLLRGHRAGIKAIQWSPDGSRLISASSDKTVRVWNIEERKPNRWDLDGEISEITWSPDDKHLAAAAGGTIQIISPDSGIPPRTLPVKFTRITSIAWQPEGTGLAFTSPSSYGEIESFLSVWDLNEESEVIRVPLESDPGGYYVSWAPDGQRVATAGFGGLQPTRIWSGESGALLSELKREGRKEARDLAWSPDGKFIAQIQSKQILLWDTETGEIATHFDIPSAFRCEWSPNGKQLAIGDGNGRVANAGFDGNIRIFDVETEIEVRCLKGNMGRINSISWSPSGQRIGSASSDQTIRIWDVESGKELMSFRGYSGSVQNVAWSHDGKKLAASGYPKTIRVWDATKGYEAERKRLAKAAP